MLLLTNIFIYVYATSTINSKIVRLWKISCADRYPPSPLMSDPKLSSTFLEYVSFSDKLSDRSTNLAAGVE
jgi:hypothetical protein